MRDEQRLQPGAHVGSGEDGVRGEVARRQPHRDVVEVEAPVRGEPGEIGRDDDDLVARHARQGKLVLPERATGEVADQGADLERDHRRGHRRSPFLQERGESQLGVGLGRRRLGGGGGTDRRGELLDERPPGVEAAPRPFGGTSRDNGDGTAARRRRHARDVGDLELGDTRQLLDPHPPDGFDVRLRLSVRGDCQRELDREVPLERGVGPHEAEKITEQPGQEAPHVRRGS